MKKLYILILSLITINIVNAQWTQIGSDVDGEGAGDNSGYSVSMSADGSIMAVGAPYNNGNAGHVRVYEYNGTNWVQLGSDIDGETGGDLSGYSVSLSADGMTVVIGSYGNDDGGYDHGQVRVYEYNAGVWGKKGGDLNGTSDWEYFGRSVSISADGDIIAVGADGNDVGGVDAGQVKVFEYDGTNWIQLGASINGEAAGDYSGCCVRLNDSGDILAIGAYNNDGNGSNSGHVRVFSYTGSVWLQIGSDIDGEAANDFSGRSLSLNKDGSKIVIGADGNDGNGSSSGHVRVYEYTGSWVQIGADIDGEASGDQSGYAVSLNDDGTRVAIGAWLNDGYGPNSGHTRIYSESGGVWSKIGADINGEMGMDYSGNAVSLNGDGTTVAIGALGNDGSFGDAGQVRVYTCNTYSTINEVECDSYTSPSGKYTWTTSGTYLDTISNAMSCNEILIINLTIINSTSSTINETSCGSYTSPGGNYTWTSSGTYYDTIPNSNGCDSVITINLTINDLPVDLGETNNLVAFYPFNNNANDTSGNGYNGTLYGPTPVSDRNLVPNSAYSFDGINDYILIGDPVPTGLQIQDEITLSAWIYATQYPGSTNLGLIVGSQCDACGHMGASIFLDGRTNPDGITAPAGHIHFQIGDGSSWHHSNSNSQVPLNQWVHIVATRKANEAAKIYYNGVLQPVNGLPWDGTIAYTGSYFAIGRQRDIINRFFKGTIDDVRVYDRAINAAEVFALSQPISVYADNDTICENTSTDINLINSQNGITYQLKKNGSDYGSPQLSTGGDLIFNTGNIGSVSQFTIQATDGLTGCSIILDTIITITINNNSTSTIHPVECYSYTSPSGNYTWTTSGIYSDVIPNAIGCDSIITIDLTINTSNTGDTNAVECDSFDWYGTNYTTSGDYTHTLTNMYGCDSILSLHLTINNSETGDTTAIECDSFEWYGTNYSTSGDYTHVLQNIQGCDSLLTLHLTINNSETSDTTAVECDSFDWYGTNYTSSGDYTHLLTNMHGCDSLVTLHLTVNNSETGDTTAVECDSFDWYGTNYTTSGDYTHMLTNLGGCDSLVTLHLSINYSNTGDTTAVECNSFDWYGTNYTSDGNYTHMLTNMYGCDSLVTLHLTINNVIALITQSGDSLIADPTGAVYQWLDCNNGMAPMQGDTNQIFIPVLDGDYAVVVTQNGCNDTTACYNVVGTNILGKDNDSGIIIYPNPAKNRIYIDGLNGSCIINLYDHTGKKIIEKNIKNISGRTTLDLNNITSSGYYLIECICNNNVYRQSVIIQK